MRSWRCCPRRTSGARSCRCAPAFAGTCRAAARPCGAVWAHGCLRAAWEAGACAGRQPGGRAQGAGPLRAGRLRLPGLWARAALQGLVGPLPCSTGGQPRPQQQGCAAEASLSWLARRFGCESGGTTLAEAHLFLDGNAEALPPYRGASCAPLAVHCVPDCQACPGALEGSAPPSSAIAGVGHLPSSGPEQPTPMCGPAARRDWCWERPTHVSWTSGCVELPVGGYQPAECHLHCYPPGARRAVVVLR